MNPLLFGSFTLFLLPRAERGNFLALTERDRFPVAAGVWRGCHAAGCKPAVRPGRGLAVRSGSEWSNARERAGAFELGWRAAGCKPVVRTERGLAVRSRQERTGRIEMSKGAADCKSALLKLADSSLTRCNPEREPPAAHFPPTGSAAKFGRARPGCRQASRFATTQPRASHAGLPRLA